MNVTEIKIYPVDDGKLRAYANIIFDDCFCIRGLKLIRAEDKYFVAMPSHKRQDGVFRDIAFPIKEEMRKEIELQILRAYEQNLQTNQEF